MALTLTVFEADWTSTTKPKTVVITGALTGDWLFVITGSGHTGGANVTDITTSTTVGTTGSWTEPQESLNAGSAPYVSSAVAQVTADGDVTVQVAITTTASPMWGFAVVQARGSSGLGVSGFVNTSATQVVSLTVQNSSAVFYGSFDFDAGAVGTGWTPTTNVTLIERSSPGTNYTVHSAYWTSQSPGTRNFGSTGAGITSAKIIGLEILDATPVLPDQANLNRPWRIWGRDRSMFKSTYDLFATAAVLVDFDPTLAGLGTARLLAAYTDRRSYPQQRLYPDPSLLSSALLEDALLGSADDLARHRSWFADRRLLPRQETAITGPDVSAVVGIPGPIPAVPWRRDPVTVQQRLYQSGLIDTGLLEDALLGGAETAKRTNVPASHVDRRLVPQYTLRESPPDLLGTALYEVPGGVSDLVALAVITHLRASWLRTGLTLADQSSGPDLDPTLIGYEPPPWRRDQYPPAQRSYQTPGLFDLDPTLISYKLLPWRRDLYPPQQRPYESGLINTALLEVPGPLNLAASVITHWRSTWLRLRQSLADQSSAAPDLDPTLSGYDFAPWRRDSYSLPQRQALIDVSAQLISADPTLNGYDFAPWRRDPYPPQQRLYESGLIDTALLEVPGAVDLALAVITHWRPSWSRLRQALADQSSAAAAPDLDPTLIGYKPPGWRRDPYLPQQRQALIDVSTLAADPVLAAWLPLWLAQNMAAYGSRRLVPQQPDRESDPGLLITAELEDALLGAADDLRRHRTWFINRRLMPQQRAAFEILPFPADPLLIIGAEWRRRLTPRTHAPRWVLRPWWQSQQFQGAALILFEGMITGGMLAGPGSSGGSVITPGARGGTIAGPGSTGSGYAGPGITGHDGTGGNVTGGGR